VPIANEEGRIISEALGAKRSILLANHGMLTTGRSLDEALYLAIHLERACELHLRARSLGPIKPIAHDLAVNAHSFMTKPGMIASTVDYWLRQAKARHGDALN